MGTTRITIEATIAAGRKRVWTCLTDPEHITGWNFASDDWCCPRARNDLKAGGRYCARMEARDGSFGFDFDAVYDEVLEPERMVYTLTDGRVVATDLEDMGDSTKVVTTFDAESENSIDMQRDGWQAILNNFKKYVETNEQPAPA